MTTITRTAPPAAAPAIMAMRLLGELSDVESWGTVLGEEEEDEDDVAVDNEVDDVEPGTV